LADVLRDAENFAENFRKPCLQFWSLVFSLLFLGGAFAIIVALGLTIPAVATGMVTFGSLFWMHKKIERWAQSLIDEYASRIANGKVREGKTEAKPVLLMPKKAAPSACVSYKWNIPPSAAAIALLAPTIAIWLIVPRVGSGLFVNREPAAQYSRPNARAPVPMSMSALTDMHTRRLIDAGALLSDGSLPNSLTDEQMQMLVDAGLAR